MTDILLTAIFKENLALSFFLGICTFLAVSERVNTALGLGIAVVIIQTITVTANSIVSTYLLAPGAWSWAGFPNVDLSHLQLIAFIGVIAAKVQIMEMILERYSPTLYRALGIFLPLITVNCAILGGSLFMVERQYTVSEAAIFGFGSGFGWALAIITFAAIRERLRYANMPEGLNGLGSAFLVTGLLSLGFAAFAGVG
jgi:Na+-transporting NADH:ubiquinone oxidoreductase subunit E